ncbi:matrixin family metalloprotease [Planomonospora sp. ID91781]|uniref:matrixin family metalloprotease n=1 Tax=Planomonospora sp. ID91781 TaxID=2738135 RepID=UPI0018C44F02|nr:matrixin family metalloprotease [Planomonospora sp. ID91781]MBG0826129.1 matrixin family metalloprotease [Planomonospora sp. ID91781]
MRGRPGQVMPAVFALATAFVVLVVSVLSTVAELRPRAAAPAPGTGPAVTEASAVGTAPEDAPGDGPDGPDGLQVTMDVLYAGGPAAEAAEGTAGGSAAETAGEAVPGGGIPSAAKASRAAASASRAQCRDTAYALAGWRVKGTAGWYYNSSGAPSAVSRTALSAIASAARSLVGASNQCGLPAPFKAGQKYLGATKRTAAVSTSSRTSCGTEDGHSVVAWKRLGSTALAVTCTWTRSGQVVSSDIVINTRYRWHTSRPSRCTSSFDLASVLTHEWGHAFGLTHVSPSKHGTQVMASTIPACSSVRTLGAGDHRAMRRLYGTR